ncbi:hypothetical protein DFH08DRAFT_897088 [Mycena albidolilacea]|uniref:Uncharacterized protein n=1 Tax=Mycena albidolilacea TaxID=1033008 RepID=A0AAD6Z8N9_9AGAR|nr:hypothetical protein DFH08DRAFT_897088 [Mycena albidolilacea]
MGHAAAHVLSTVNIAIHAPSSQTSPRAPSKPYPPRYTSCASRTSPPTSFTMCTVPHTGGTPLGMSSAPLTSPCMPPSRTSLQAPSTLCVARRTPSAPSASPRMSLYRARRRARPPTCIHPRTCPPRPAFPVACTARSMSPTSCTRACTTPASPMPPGTLLCTSPASSCMAPASSSSLPASLASAALPRMSHMAHVAVYALEFATRWASRFL